MQFPRIVTDLDVVGYQSQLGADLDTPSLKQDQVQLTRQNSTAFRPDQDDTPGLIPTYLVFG
jgi:hypothetical protein